MIKIKSYVLLPDVKITSLKDVKKNPANFFVNVNDHSKMARIIGDLDKDYLSGAIYCSYNDRILLDFDYWDLVDQLWGYLITLVEEVMRKGEGTMYFPDQPLQIAIKAFSTDDLRFTIDKKSFSIPKQEFLSAILDGASEFFECMTSYLPDDGFYDFDLKRINRMKNAQKSGW